MSRTTAGENLMSDRPSLLDELRTQYEAARQSPHERADVPGFQEIDAQMRKSFRWLEKAIAYLDGLKPAIEHRFDLGHGLVFESPRLARAYVGQHERRIVGFPVLDEINIYYEITAAKPLTIEVGFGGEALAEKALDEAGLQYTSRRMEDRGGVVQKCVITVPPAIPSAISFHADYQTGLVRVSLINVDRFDRVILEFHSAALDETVLEDLVRFMLGRSAAFLHRAPLAGFHGQPQA
jgi:hypothetical protein